MYWSYLNTDRVFNDFRLDPVLLDAEIVDFPEGQDRSGIPAVTDKDLKDYKVDSKDRFWDILKPNTRSIPIGESGGIHTIIFLKIPGIALIFGNFLIGGIIPSLRKLSGSKKKRKTFLIDWTKSIEIILFGPKIFPASGIRGVIVIGIFDQSQTLFLFGNQPPASRIALLTRIAGTFLPFVST